MLYFVILSVIKISINQHLIIHSPFFRYFAVAQYDKTSQYDKGIVILSLLQKGEKSKEIKICLVIYGYFATLSMTRQVSMAMFFRLPRLFHSLAMTYSFYFQYLYPNCSQNCLPTSYTG